MKSEYLSKAADLESGDNALLDGKHPVTILSIGRIYAFVKADNNSWCVDRNRLIAINPSPEDKE